MNLYLEKCMRIVSDLAGFCHYGGAEEFQISIKHDKANKSSVITVSCPIPELSEKLIKDFTDELNLPRQREVEKDYWTLSGNLAMSGELTLVGMMIDEAKVDYENGVLNIHVLRKD